MAKKKQKIPEKKSGLQTIHIILAALIILALAIYFLNPGEKSPEKTIAGDYSKLSKPSTHEPGKVKIMEFLNFKCGHCYELQKSMPPLLEKYGDKLEITYIPINFSGQSSKSVEAYIIAKQMGKGDEMYEALFTAGFEKNMDIMESTIAIETVASGIGLGPDFNRKFESGAAAKEAFDNFKLANNYRIEGTPTVIIDGNLMVVPTIANLDTVIGSILEQDS
ncbi:MAG: hypothetical protein C3F06_11980 [Candidatus Methanoperedenaceae archaeon]|nr:MAG: hypothetical protein C3F06_11980 [Candidatus Methanoperedenaceae archaeon]